MHTEKTPLLIGLRAARANLVPGLIVQAAMVAIVAAYYIYPTVNAWLSVLAEAKLKGGLVASGIAGALAGSVLPEILTILVFQGGNIQKQNGKNLLFTLPYWILDGLMVDLFYRSQTLIFGGQVDFITVLKKVLLDQLVFTPFVTTTIGMAWYEWRNQGFALHNLSHSWTFTFYKNKSFPTLIACWGVWIPLVAIIYSLPPLLQFPLFSLGLTFWVMLFNYINTAHKKKSTLSFSAPVVDAPAIQS